MLGPWALALAGVHCLAAPTPNAQATPPSLDVDCRSLVSRGDLVYEAPVGGSVEGQPIGNGTMGTLVWSTPGAIQFQINRVDVFAVNRNHAGSRDGPADYCGGCAQVTVDVGGTPFAPDGPFVQDLSLYDAESVISGRGVRARCFVSSARDLLVLEVDDRREQPQAIRVTVSMWRSPEVRTGRHVASYRFPEVSGKLLVTQQFSEADHYCASAVAACMRGRRVEREETEETACALVAPAQRGRTLILVSSAASWTPDADPGDRALAVLDQATRSSYPTLGREHRRWWAGFWSRTYVHISSPDGLGDFMQRVRTLHLYYMASSSRGALPPKWNGSIFITEGDARNWGSQFWVWTTEISHFPLYAADAIDLTDPFFDMYVRQLPACEEAARQRWDAGGAHYLEAGPFDGPVVLPEEVAREYQDVYLGRKPNTELSLEARALGQFECVLTQFADGRRPPLIAAGRYSWVSHIVSSGSELAAQAWWRYRYTGDTAWLRSHAYPLLRGTVEFYRQLAKRGEDGRYHIYGTNQHEEYWGVDDGLIDLAAIRGTVPLAIRAAKILGVDRDLRAKWQELLDHLVAYPMGSDPGAKALGGVLADDVWAPGHLGAVPGTHNVAGDVRWPVFPFEDWTLETRDPTTDSIVHKASELAGLRQTLLNAELLGSAVRLPIMEARVGRGAELPWVLASYFHAYPSLPNGLSLFEGATAPSIEHLGCITTALQEALLQSVSPRPGEPEIISVFPAWPQGWEASFRLLARGGFLVSSLKSGGRVEFVEVESRLGEECRLRNPWARPCTLEEAGGLRREVQGQILHFDTKQGARYLIYPAGSPGPGPRPVPPEPPAGPAVYSFVLPNGNTVEGRLGIAHEHREASG